MKRLSLLLLPLLTLALAQNGADSILKALTDAQRGGERQRATMTMEVARPNDTRSYSMNIVSDGSERSLIQVTAPSRDAGQAFLKDGSNLFLYSPQLRRALRLPPSSSSDSFLGSDISYSDMAGRDLEEAYRATLSHEDAKQIELTLTPKANAATPYGKAVLQAAKIEGGYAPTSYTYFDQRGAAVKRIDFSNYSEQNGRHFPLKVVVTNLLNPAESTTITTSDPDFSAAVPENCFSERALEAGC